MQDNSARLRSIQARASALTADASRRAAGDMLIELDALQRELSSIDGVYTEAYVAAVFALVGGFNEFLIGYGFDDKDLRARLRPLIEGGS